MVKLKVYNDINAHLVVSSFAKRNVLILIQFGLNIQKANKPIHSLQISINAVQKLFSEELIT